MQIFCYLDKISYKLTHVFKSIPDQIPAKPLLSNAAYYKWMFVLQLFSYAINRNIFLN